MAGLADIVRDAVLRRAILEGRLLNAHLADLAAVFRLARGEIRQATLAGDAALVADLRQRDLSAMLAEVRALYDTARRAAVPMIEAASADAATAGLEFWNRAWLEAMPSDFGQAITLTNVNPAFIEAASTWPAVEGGATASQWGAESVLRFNRAAQLQAAQAAGFGETVGQLAQRLMGLSDKIGAHQAETMARSAFIHAGGRVADQWAAANRRVIKGQVWVATLDDDTCIRCGAIDGNVYDLDAGEPHPPLPLHPRCRCSVVPVLRTWRELGIDADELEPATRASWDGQVPATLRFDEWLRGQPVKVQRDVLGPGRYARWVADGQPPLARYTDDGRRVLRLDELMESRAA